MPTTGPVTLPVAPAIGKLSPCFSVTARKAATATGADVGSAAASTDLVLPMRVLPCDPGAACPPAAAPCAARPRQPAAGGTRPGHWVSPTGRNATSGFFSMQ
jgi:hypothetical protein